MSGLHAPQAGDAHAHADGGSLVDARRLAAWSALGMGPRWHARPGRLPAAPAPAPADPALVEADGDAPALAPHPDGSTDGAGTAFAASAPGAPSPGRAPGTGEAAPDSAPAIAAPAPDAAPATQAVVDWLFVCDDAAIADPAAARLLQAIVAALGAGGPGRPVGASAALGAWRDAPPRVAVAFGEVAARMLLGAGATLAATGGRAHEASHAGARATVVVTHGLDMLLGDGRLKAIAWRDLRLAARLLEAAAG